jgi:hypothetical protein
MESDSQNLVSLTPLPSRTVLVKLPDGGIIRAEVAGGPIEQDVAEGAVQFNFDEVLNNIKSLGKAFVGAVKEIQPKKAVVEFSLELSAEPGKLTALLVKGSGKASIKVSLEWS